MSAGAQARGQAIAALRSLETIRLDGLRFRLVDARGMIVGKLATQIATLLQGKDKPIYTPKQNMGDVVIVINAAHLHFTQDKWDTKLYRWHTGFPGGLKSRTAVEQWDRDPAEVLRKAVNGMLPKNHQRIYRMDKLKVFPEADHPFKALPLSLYVPSPRTLHLPGMGWPLPSGMEPMNPAQFNFRMRASPHLQQQPVTKQQSNTDAELGPGLPALGANQALQQQGKQGLQGQGQQQGQQQGPGKGKTGPKQGLSGASSKKGSGDGVGRPGAEARAGGKVAKQQQAQRGQRPSSALGLADLEQLLTPEELAVLRAQRN